jgi:hypothetical protein
VFNQRNAIFRLGMLIVVVAGLWTIAHLILTVAGVTANDYWDVALLILFLLALIVAFMQFAQERSALTAVPSTERQQKLFKALLEGSPVSFPH